MPFVCQKCGYVSKDSINECPNCGGLVEEEEPEIDWLGEGKKKDSDDVKNL